ncbi:MAG: DUF1570 domain-containing protein [Thermoanaerobaculia bacterium]|nr:DUF1570 domain-containing protein [Thermoanaerobaculia bacterium]
MRRAVLSLLAAVAAAAAPAAVAGQDLPPANLRWLEVSSPHFEVVTDAKEKAAREVVDSLEALHRLLASATGGGPAPMRTRVFVFRDGGSLRRYSPWPNRQDVAGFFVSGTYRDYMGIDASTLEGPVGVVYHEYLHAFADANFPGVPLWFNEGLAEYYSTFRIQGRKAQIGKPRWEHLEWLRKNPNVDLRSLLEVTTRSPLYNETSRAGAFYAQSWAVVHYLFAAPERRAGVAAFLGRVADGEAVASALDAAFDVSIADFERGLGAYVRSRSFGYFEVPVESRTDSYEVRILDTADALARLGDFAANLGAERERQARLHFEESLRLDRDWGPAHRGLGWLCHQRGDLACAVAEYRQAAALGADPVGLYLLAEGLVDQVELAAPAADLGPAQLDALGEARRALARAVELDGGFTPARVALGWTYLYDGDPDAGLAAMQAAAAAAPADARVYFGHAVLSARRGDIERAWRIADELAAMEASKPSSLARPELMPQVWRSVALEQVGRATAEVNAGREEEALALVAALRPRLAAYRLAEETQFADEIETHARHNLAVRRINEAAALSREGEARRALEILDAAIPDLADPQAVEQARQLRERVVARLAP